MYNYNKIKQIHNNKFKITQFPEALVDEILGLKQSNKNEHSASMQKIQR